MRKLLVILVSALVLCGVAGAGTTSLSGRAWYTDGTPASGIYLAFTNEAGDFHTLELTGNHGSYATALPQDTYYVYAFAPCVEPPGCMPVLRPVTPGVITIVSGAALVQPFTVGRY